MTRAVWSAIALEVSEPTPATPFELYRTDTFRDWFEALQDQTVIAAVRARLVRLSLGNPGDAAPVGDGVSEMRIHVGAGWRLYYIKRGQTIFVLLAGGSKRTQVKDIQRAKALAEGGLQLVEEQRWLNG